MPEAVGIYARISQDREGDGLGVARQLQDCRAEAARRGWPVAEEYIDDDISAYSGKPRPAYRRMLADLADRRIDGVIVWHLDRLHRRPIELEEFVQTCTAGGVTNVVTLHGDFNLGSGDGLLVARLLSAVAANESDAKRRRGRRKALETAQAGKPHMGGPRPFGYLADRVTPHPTEAPVLHELAQRALAGETLVSLCDWLDERGIRTVSGKTMRSNVLRQILINPRYWGMRTYNGEVVGEAQWPGLIPRDLGETVRAKLTDPARRRERTPRRYLLSGMCRCGRCDAKMYSVPRWDTRRYICRSGIDFARGCGKIVINAVSLERLISEAVLYRLDTPDLAAAMAGKARVVGEASELQASIDADVAQLEELTKLYSERTISAVEWVQARDAIEARLTASRKRYQQIQGFSEIKEFVGNSDNLRRQWGALNLNRQRAIVKAILDHVVILPAKRKTNVLDPTRVNPVWRI